MFEQRAPVREGIGTLAAVQHNADIRHAFLLKLVRVELLRVPRADPPVDSARRIARLIIAHTEKFHSRSGDARRDHPRIDARAPRPNRDVLEPRHIRENEDLTRSEEHTSELQSPTNLVCRLLLEKKKKK